MVGNLRNLVIAGLASVMLLGAAASGANAENRHGTLPSRQMMKSHAMHERMMHRHDRMYRMHRERMMHRHMRHHRAM